MKIDINFNRKNCIFVFNFVKRWCYIFKGKTSENRKHKNPAKL